MKRGIRVVLASGRPTPGMRRYEEELELVKYGGYLLSFNGARVVDCFTGEIIWGGGKPAAQCYPAHC